jgi:hypothetical protein
VRASSSRCRDERGIAPSTPLALVSAAAVVLAGAVYVGTGGPRHDDTTQASATSSAARRAASATAGTTAAASSRPPVSPRAPEKKQPKPRKPVVHRGQTYVEVFNNSGISGLAGSTAARAQGAGWQVIGSDNWYGTIAASTVYYPPRLKAAAKVLARDLGIGRVKPSIAPMRGDRLTVILTGDYA